MGKESAFHCRRPSLIPGLGKYPGGGHANPLQNSYLENPTDRGAWWATVHRVAESDTAEHTCTRCVGSFFKCSTFQHHLFKRQCFPLNFAIAFFSKLIDSTPFIFCCIYFFPCLLAPSKQNLSSSLDCISYKSTN